MRTVILAIFLILNTMAMGNETEEAIPDLDDYHEISWAKYLGGGLFAISPGFGLGHLVQERWLEKGYLFTFLPVGFFALSIIECQSPRGDLTTCLSSITLAGAGIVGVKIWEIIDAWRTPLLYNGRIYVGPLPSPSESRIGPGFALTFQI